MGWKRKLITPWFSQSFIDELKLDLRLFLWRVRCFSPGNLRRVRHYVRQNDIRVNLGAGRSPRAGWVNVDLCDSPLGFRWDLRWKLPFRTGSVSRLHCEHFVDQLHYPDETLNFLTECRRILKDDGEFRLSIANAAIYLKNYAAGNLRFFHEMRFLGGATTPLGNEIEVVNQAFRIRRFGYDEKTLVQQLRAAGFAHVESTGRDTERFIDLPDWWRPNESLYLLVHPKAAPAKKSDVAKSATKVGPAALGISVAAEQGFALLDLAVQSVGPVL